MKSLLKAIFVLMTILEVSSVYGHGEDKLGPNGGFLQMPGAFHTEVVPGGNKLRVFLLDINWKNPSIKDSLLKVNVMEGTKNLTLKCDPSVDHYMCVLPKGLSLLKGKIEVQAKREGKMGNLITYELPLRLKKNTGDHGTHH